MYQSEDIIIIDGEGFTGPTYSKTIVPMGQRHSVVTKRPPTDDRRNREIEVVDLEPESDTMEMDRTGAGSENDSVCSTPANADVRSGHRSSSSFSSPVEGEAERRQEQNCDRQQVGITEGGESDEAGKTLNTTVSSEVSMDFGLTGGLITVAPVSKWAAEPSSEEEMEEGEITTDEEICQENQTKASKQVNQIGLTSFFRKEGFSEDKGKNASMDCNAGTSSLVSSKQVHAQIVNECVEGGGRDKTLELTMLKEQITSLQKTVDTLKKELAVAQENCNISYAQGKEAGEKEFQQKFRSANEEDILKVANGNGAAVNNSAVTLLGHLLELRREKMAVVECKNKELSAKLIKMEADKDEIFGLLCKSNGKLLSVTEMAATLEQQVEDLKTLLAKKDAQINALREDSLVVSNAISRIQASLQVNAIVAVPPSVQKSISENQSNLVEEARSSEEMQCPPQDEVTATAAHQSEAVPPPATSLITNQKEAVPPPAATTIPHQKKAVPPATAVTRENVNVEATRVASGGSRVSKFGTRRLSPKSTRRSRRSPSPRTRVSTRERERLRDLRSKDGYSITLEDRNKILKLLPGLENWKDYCIEDIKFKQGFWTCPQCGDQRRTPQAAAAHARDKHVWVTCNRCTKRFLYGSPFVTHLKQCRYQGSANMPIIPAVKDE